MSIPRALDGITHYPSLPYGVVHAHVCVARFSALDDAEAFCALLNQTGKRTGAFVITFL